MSLDVAEKEYLFKIVYDWKYPELRDKDISSYIRMEDWVISQPYISVRLRNVLLKNMPFKYVELVNKEDFLKIKNAGLASWVEFCRLRAQEKVMVDSDIFPYKLKTV
jgi:hypothetical protein